MQLRTMRDYTKRRGWSIGMEVRDVGSGANLRPKREEMLKAARQRKLDIILVWRLDRWGRSLLDLIGTLQELNALGVGFVSLTEGLDLTTAGGRALAGMLAASPSSNATFYAIASKPGSRKRAVTASPTGGHAPCNATPAKSGPCTGTE